MRSGSSSSSSRLQLGAAIVALQLVQASAYSWNFREHPKQCGNVTVDLTGTGGKPPYRILVIPFGPNPLPAPNNEIRTIMEIPFDEGATSVSFKLKYPAHSQLVAVVSDSAGFGTGGTSVAARVLESDDDSCYDGAVRNSLDFVFDIEPRNQITQCGETRIWWDAARVQGDTQFHGVIPGGQSFAIPKGPITTREALGTGFTWKSNLRVGTTVMLVGGDRRGPGAAGSATFLVTNGPDVDESCLDANSPSSTPGSPAGGSYPTGTSGNTNPGDGDDGGGTNVGAIVGGVVGGLVALIAAILVFYFYRRRQKERSRLREKPQLNLDGDDEDGDGEVGNRDSRNDLPQFYQPEPFTVPDSSQYAPTEDGTRPLSGTATSFYTRSGTPDGSVALGYGAGMMAQGASSTGTGRKGQPRPMRPVNIIQHDDAGPSIPYQPKEDDEPETIELPPAYTAIRSESSIPPPSAQGASTTPPATTPSATNQG